MNKYQEALDYIITATNGGDGVVSQINDLKELVKKATPVRPNYEGDGYDDNGFLIYDTWICPNCCTNYEVDYEDEHEYCPICGQKLDWS